MKENVLPDESANLYENKENGKEITFDLELKKNEPGDGC